MLRVYSPSHDLCVGGRKASTILSQVRQATRAAWCRGASVDGSSGDRGGFARGAPQISATVMTQLYDEQAAKVLALLQSRCKKTL